MEEGSADRGGRGTEGGGPGSGTLMITSSSKFEHGMMI